MRRKALLVAAVTAAAVALAAPAASASFPGTNGRIAYSNTGKQIASVLPDGTKRKTLTSLGGSSLEAPMYSADGAWIVFDKYGGTNQGIYIMRSDGTQVHRIVKTPGYEWGPSWSPDGRWIVFSKDGSDSPIMAVRRDGTHLHRLGTGTGEYPRYSPDGRKVAYGGSDGRIHLMRADGTHDHAITSTGSNDYPDWSPNGRWIGFSSDQASAGVFDVWFVHPDGTSAHQVTAVGNLAYSPVFSPDGKKMAYTDTNSVWVSRLDGTHRHKILGSTGGCCIGWQAR